MAVYRPHVVKCVCGNTLEVHLADSINVKRSPIVREKILQGVFHRLECPKCKRLITVERPFYYTDLVRQCFFKVLPRAERHMWKLASTQLDAAVKSFPESLSKASRRTLRVVYGMDELREKLIAQDAGLDDRLVELLKVLIVYEHPILIRRPRLRLSLDDTTERTLRFVAVYEHDARRFGLELPRSVAKDLAAHPEKLKTWAKKSHPSASIFEVKDHWVNMWRWSPQPTALSQLKRIAESIRKNEPVDTTTAAFKETLRGLPRGSHLPGWAKTDLRTLYEYAKAKKLKALEDELFEIRFGVELEDDWSANSNAEDIDSLWNLLKNLPDTNVEGSTTIHEIRLDEGEGGGVYDPNSYDISIGSNELRDKEGFEDVVRHEVGHSVHEQKEKLVNGWLNSRFGWNVFELNDSGIDAWVKLMGGWGELAQAQRSQVREYLKTAIGAGSSWKPGPTPRPPSDHPWYAKDFGPRLAYEKTGADWFNNFKTWHRKNGYAFFLNYWYQTFIAVSVDTLSLVAKMPSSYASMSQAEFFAELYALYYDLDDPKRPVIPADVMAWFKKNIGAPETNAPRPRGSKVKTRQNRKPVARRRAKK